MTVRVADAGRSGVFRCAESEVSDLASALRFALLEARASGSQAAPTALLPEPNPVELQDLYDPTLDAWRAEDASSTLQGWLERGERADLSWGSLRIVHAASHGTVRHSTVTGLSLAVRSGRDAGAGFASGSARTLSSLDAATIVARARARATDRIDSSARLQPVALVLAPEAAAQLLELFASTALSSEAFHRGEPLSIAQLARTIASPLLSFSDDATDRAGMAISIDFEGHSKRPVPMFEDGRLLTPAVDARLARAHSLAPTASAVAFDEHRPAHLVMLRGSFSNPELLALGNGVWVSGLENLALLETRGTRFRARALGARSVRDGVLAAALPSLVWEADLLEVLRQVAGIGSELICTSRDPSFYGGTIAAALRIEATGSRFTAE